MNEQRTLISYTEDLNHCWIWAGFSIYWIYLLLLGKKKKENEGLSLQLQINLQ